MDKNPKFAAKPLHAPGSSQPQKQPIRPGTAPGAHPATTQTRAPEPKKK